MKNISLIALILFASTLLHDSSAHAKRPGRLRSMLFALTAGTLVGSAPMTLEAKEAPAVTIPGEVLELASANKISIELFARKALKPLTFQSGEQSIGLRPSLTITVPTKVGILVGEQLVRKSSDEDARVPFRRIFDNLSAARSFENTTEL